MRREAEKAANGLTGASPDGAACGGEPLAGLSQTPGAEAHGVPALGCTTTNPASNGLADAASNGLATAKGSCGRSTRSTGVPMPRA